MNHTRNTVINPLTGRTIRIGGNVYNQLLIDAYDHINGELVRRASAPQLAPRQYYLNTESNRLIYARSRRYFELIQAGWDIEDDYYLIPPWRSIETQAIITEAERRFTRQFGAGSNNIPVSYEQIMGAHRNALANLNITLCRTCLIPIKMEDGQYCNDCQT